MNVPMPVITSALFVRNMSKDEQKLSNKVVAALRNEFGGHALHKK
jgi:6-phosphogluconate dehydrogenase